MCGCGGAGEERWREACLQLETCTASTPTHLSLVLVLTQYWQYDLENLSRFFEDPLRNMYYLGIDTNCRAEVVFETFRLLYLLLARTNLPNLIVCGTLNLGYTR